MGFKDGHVKVGGRVAGTPNKKTERLLDLLGQYGVEPVKEIVNLLPALTPKEQVDVYRDLLNYVYPKRKAMELSTNDDSISEIARSLTFDEKKELVKIARESTFPKERRPEESSTESPRMGNIKR